MEEYIRDVLIFGFPGQMHIQKRDRVFHKLFKTRNCFSPAIENQQKQKSK